MVQVLHRNSEPWFSHTLTLGSWPLMFLTFSHQKLLLWFSLWNHWVSAASTVSESSGLLTSVILVPVGLLGRIHGKSESHRDQKRNQITHSSSFCIWLSQRLLLQGILWALTLFWPKAEQDQSLPLTPLCWNVRAAVSCRTDLPRLPPACGAPESSLTAGNWYFQNMITGSQVQNPFIWEPSPPGMQCLTFPLVRVNNKR